MNCIKFLLYLSVVIFSVNCNGKKPILSETNFKITKGISIANWLSSSNLSIEQKARYFTVHDIDKLSSYGFDHLRIPVEEDHIFNNEGKIDKETMDLVHSIIQRCMAKGMRVIFDLHITKSHYFYRSENDLWKSDSLQKVMVDIWKKLMVELEKYPVDSLAYELLNEPVAPEDGQWNDLAMELINVVRIVNSGRVIILGANMQNSVDHIKNLMIPPNDPNIILSFHFYEPGILTHYQASWTFYSKLELKDGVTYPGIPLSLKDFEGFDASYKRYMSRFRKEYSKYVFQKRWQEAIYFAKRKGLKLHLGEFGCLPNAGVKLQESWLEDIVSLCRKNYIAYTFWEYNNIFGFAEKGTGAIKNQRILDILTQKP